jgi:hypothetical protein
LAQWVKKSVRETLSLIIFVSDRVFVRYGKNVMDVDISECVKESVSVNLMDKSDGGNAPLERHRGAAGLAKEGTTGLVYVDWDSRFVGNMNWCSVVGTGLAGPTLSVL